MSARVGLKAMQLVLDPWQEAGQVLAEGCARHPEFADLRHLTGLLHLEQGSPQEAIDAFAAAIQLNNGYQRARFNRIAALRLREGSLDPAVWASEDPTAGMAEPEKSLWTAWFLAQRGDQGGTRAALDRLAQQPPWAGPAWFARAVWEWCWKEPKAAREALKAAAAAHPLYRRILEKRGLSPHKPIKDLGPVLSLAGGTPGTPNWDAAAWNPAAADLFEYLGALCGRHGQADEALEFYEEAFLRQGNESRHQIRLSQLALARGDEEEAVDTLCRAIELDPTSVPARIALGFEYQSQGYQAEALVQFEVAARLRPEYADVQYNLGLLYDVLGRPGDAERCLRRALEVNPGYFQARTTLSWLLLQQERSEEALTELHRLGDQGIRSADLHVQRAQAHLALGQASEAIAELEQAVALNPSYARTYYVLGQAYRTLGLRRKAQCAWQQYLACSHEWGEAQMALEPEG